jgi:hypothetical protein
MTKTTKNILNFLCITIKDDYKKEKYIGIINIYTNSVNYIIRGE